MNKFIYYFRKFSSYILFIFTLLSFIFTENEWLLLTFVSVAFLAFFKINFLELFKKKRYLSKLELFFSILLLIRILLLFEINIYYKVLTYSLGLFFIVVYFFNFSNTENVTTNILGVKKHQESDLEDGFDQEDYENDEEYLEEDEYSQDQDEDSQEQEDYENDEEYLEEDEDVYSQDQEEDLVVRKDSLKTKKKAELPKKSKISKK